MIMIDSQMILWVLLSLIAGFGMYLVLTEGKSSFLFGITFVFSLLFGISTGYFWIQATGGMEAASPFIVLLPLLSTGLATIILLAYYKVYHNRKAFPRIPALPVGRGATITALIVVVCTTFFFSMMVMPPAGTAPSIQSLGTADVTSASEMGDLTYVPSSGAIDIQYVANALTLKQNPVVGDYLYFKVDVEPNAYYTSPVVKVIVVDAQGNLIPDAKLITYTNADGSLSGKVLCDTAGAFQIQAYMYDTAISTTQPLDESNIDFSVSGTMVFNSFHAMIVMLISSAILFVYLLKKQKKNL